MARAYAGVLGAIAMSLCIVRGLTLGMLPHEILSQCPVVFVCFALVGYGIGFAGDKTVRDSVEKRFRSEMAALQARAQKDTTQKTKTGDA